MDARQRFDRTSSNSRDTTTGEIGLGDMKDFRGKLQKIEQEQRAQREILERLTAAYEMVRTDMDIRFEGLRESMQQECIDTTQEAVQGLTIRRQAATKQSHGSMDKGVESARGTSTASDIGNVIGLQSESLTTMQMLQDEKHGDKKTPEEVNAQSSIDSATSMSHSKTLIQTEIQKGSYEFAESVYDSAVLLFSSLVHVGDSCMMLFGLLSCIYMQWICILLVDDLIDPASVESAPEVHEAARRWRYDHAHTVTNMDWAQQMSLARSVCAESNWLPISQGQVRMLSNIREYTHLAPSGVPVGIIAIHIILARWISFILKEIGDCLRSFDAILAVDRGWEGQLRFSTSRQDSGPPKFTINYMTTSRFMWFFFIVFVRMSFALILCIYGCRWLVYTVSIQDLILNASALQFIVETHSTLYALCASAQIRYLLHHISTQGGMLAKQSEHSQICIPIMLLTFGTIVGIWFMFGLALPNLSKMRDLEEVLCGGWQDFVLLPPQSWAGSEEQLLVAPSEHSRVPQWFDEHVQEIIRNRVHTNLTVMDLLQLYQEL